MRLNRIISIAAAMLIPLAGAHGQGFDVDFPLGIGLRLPTYDRIDGLSVAYGPTISVSDERFRFDPRVIYRSRLGKFDPSGTLSLGITPDTSLKLILTGGRGTYTNERWIRSDLMNSVASFFYGSDSRNYFRADRGDAMLQYALGTDLEGAMFFAGGRLERAWSTGAELPGGRIAWSVLNRNDSTNGMRRYNPTISGLGAYGNESRIRSGLAGAEAHLKSDRMNIAAGAYAEIAPSYGASGRDFSQVTTDFHTDFGTFARERFQLDGHGVFSTGTTPRQRYAYLGGSGTLATVDILSRGGDELYFADMRYVIPIIGVDLPFVGEPYVAPRFAVGAASTNGFGRPIQNVGLRVGAGILSADFVVNPRTHETGYGAGITIAFPQ